LLKFYKSEWLDDWYCMDGASFGQPEGTKEEWMALIEGIERGEAVRFKRVGTVITEYGVQFYSPRNAISADDYAFVHKDELELLLKVMLKVMKGVLNCQK
jgi:hypothetical protein